MYLYVVSESFYFVNFCIKGGKKKSKIEVLAAVYIGPEYFLFIFFFLRQMYCYKILFVSCQHICIVIHILTIFFFFFFL